MALGCGSLHLKLLVLQNVSLNNCCLLTFTGATETSKKAAKIKSEDTTMVFIVVCASCWLLMKRAYVRDERQQQTEHRLLWDWTPYWMTVWIFLSGNRGKLAGKLYVKVVMTNAWCDEDFTCGHLKEDVICWNLERVSRSLFSWRVL